jgi:hypothetical protein
VKGEAVSALGFQKEAHSLLSAALENARANEEWFLLWRMHASLGRLNKATGRQIGARKEYSAAGELIEEQAACIDDEVLKENFLVGAQRESRISPKH